MSALSAGNLITFSKDYGRRDVKGREESERKDTSMEMNFNMIYVLVLQFPSPKNAFINFVSYYILLVVSVCV